MRQMMYNEKHSLRIILYNWNSNFAFSSFLVIIKNLVSNK